MKLHNVPGVRCADGPANISDHAPMPRNDERQHGNCQPKFTHREPGAIRNRASKGPRMCMFLHRRLPSVPPLTVRAQMSKWFRARLHAALDRALPERCAACRAVDCPTLLCSYCTRGQTAPQRCASVELPGCAVPAYAPFLYSPEVRSAIHRLKFERHPELARRAAHAMYGVLPPRARSYPTLLQRLPGATKQSHLSRSERFTNLVATFDLDVTQRPLPVGSSVILVDDVFTTGATATACCKVLYDCGYKLTAVVTLAQVAHP
jgi:predicted amidophosphoribosyltransferase